MLKKFFTKYDPNEIFSTSVPSRQFIMQNEFKEYAGKLRFFIGDVRDKERLVRAFESVELVIKALEESIGGETFIS